MSLYEIGFAIEYYYDELKADLIRGLQNMGVI